MQAPELDRQTRAELVGRRIEQVRRLLEDRSAGGLLLDSRRDFAWLTLGGLNHVVLASEMGAAPILVTRDAAVVLAPTNERERIAAEEVAGLPIEVESLPWWESDAAARAAEARTGAAVLLRAENVASELEGARTALVREEHARMEWLAAEISTAIASMSAPAASETEEDMVAAIAGLLTRHGVRIPVVLAAADERIDRYRHPLPTATPIRRRLMLVLVVERWGLHVAHTEFFEREEPSEDLRRRRATLDDVLGHMREATAVGRTLGGVLDAARGAYARHGMENEWTLHHQGGTIGYAGRERIAVPGDETPIRPGMAFAWNPSVRGLKLEETLYLDTEGRQNILTGPAAG